MEIRTFAKKDIPIILEFEKNHAPDKPIYARFDLEAINFLFRDTAHSQAIGLYDKNILVGWGSYRKKTSYSNGTFEISSIVIHTDYRGKKLGSYLFDWIISAVKTIPLSQRIILTVSPLNIQAIILYLKRNFIVYDYKRDVYGPNTDRLFMELRLK